MTYAIDILIPFLEEFEGYRDKSYVCPAGKWTIGYGTTRINGVPVSNGMTCTKEQAKQWVIDDLRDIVVGVTRLVRVKLNECQLAMLYDFCYNLGLGAFAKSTLLKLLNQNNIDGAAQEFEKWVYSAGKIENGLVRRRLAEKKVFLGECSVDNK